MRYHVRHVPAVGASAVAMSNAGGSVMPERLAARAGPSGSMPAHATEQARQQLARSADMIAPLGSIAVTAKRRAEIAKRFGTQAQRSETIDAMRRGRVEAAHAALSSTTWKQNESIMRYWFEFCEVAGYDPLEFGVVYGDCHPPPSQLAWEDEALADFSWYVVNFPRKDGSTNNVGNTAASYVSHVRTYYEFRLNPPRRVGGAGTSADKDGLGHALRRCLKGLRKLHPSDPNHSKKAAVLRQHLIALRRMLDLRDPFSAMIWAFCCVAWQCGRRSGELVRKRTGAWNPRFDMHRGRLTWDANGARARLALGPDKTDPTGEQGHMVFMPYDDTATINAAAAVRHMLAMDPTPESANESTPLFRDTRGGWVCG